MKYVDVNSITKISKDILESYGVQENIAAIVVNHLVENTLIGQNGHGIMRVAEYSKMLDNGYISSTATPEVKKLRNNVIHVDGNNGFGIVSMYHAVEELAQTLKDQPIAMAAVTNVGHTGRIGAYAEYLALKNYFGIIYGGGAHKQYKSVAPFGGKNGVFSTNPIAMAMPGKDNIPVSADFATSATAGGKLRLAKSTGKQLPEGQILDKDGNPTNSPDDYFAGGVILPSAGAKGTGMAIICEMLCYAMLGEVHELNWFMIAADPSIFTNMSDYFERAEEFLCLVENCSPAPGFEKVTYPGQYEELLKRKYLKKGLPLDENVLVALIDKAKQKGIAIPVNLCSASL